MQPFHEFARIIEARFKQLSQHELFVTATGDHLWRAYLESFPEGSNPIYKERTEHDCSCCKQFIRNIGSVVAIIDGKVQTIWNVEGLEYPYDQVAKALSEVVTLSPITGLFRTTEGGFGAQHTIQLLEGGETKKWDHFHGTINSKHRTGQPDKVRGDYATTVGVFKRGLNELLPQAIETVVELIESNSLYRGEEHLPSIQAFMKLQTDYMRLLTVSGRRAFEWSKASDRSARFRNTVIGTLIQDLSLGVELESAVRSFESKVAPTNYKRPTALITPRMVQDAMKTIGELELEPALERRHAKISDVSVNNVLWVDNIGRARMRGGFETLLMSATTEKVVNKRNIVDVGIDEFMASVLPTATNMEILVKNDQTPNFMSVTAPVHENLASLFKWDNSFAWSYDGNITDSIKERVKNAGGNVTSAAMRVSLAWFNYDDLDIHVHEPSGNQIFFANRDGKLDVDMNVNRNTREPVENVSWTPSKLKDGTYQVVVNQYNQRETSDVGFEIEVENEGKLQHYSYSKAAKGAVPALTITVKDKVITGISVASGVVGGSSTQEKWNVKTETFTKVQTIMQSPNHWDENQAGNKHWFFILEGCRNPDPVRGIYNEFLNSNLDKHRKVFEILGDKTKCHPAEDQLSGVGFSSTRNDTVTVRVAGDKTRQTYNIQF